MPLWFWIGAGILVVLIVCFLIHELPMILRGEALTFLGEMMIAVIGALSLAALAAAIIGQIKAS